jgi:hypothetical protein
MVETRPFTSKEAMTIAADKIWNKCSREEILEVPLPA